MWTNPRPADFDEFWDRSIAEMLAIDPKVEMIPSKFQTDYAECFDLYFTGIGGSRIYAKLLRPRRPEDRKGPAVVQYHGYSGDGGDWSSKLGYVAAGFTYAGLDCRGQGGLSEDITPVRGTTVRGHIIRGLNDPDPKKLYYRSVFLDTAELVRILMSMDGVDPDRIGINGGSQGGGLTVACAALEPRVKCAAVQYPFLSDYCRVRALDMMKDAYFELEYFFRQFDPIHEREEEIFNRLGYIDIQNLAPRIKAKVMMQTGLMDTVCPPSTQFATYNKITSPKEVVIYPEYRHEKLAGGLDRVFTFMIDNLLGE